MSDELRNLLGTGAWAYDEDRTYHGFNDDSSSDPDDRFRLTVELSEFGPTEREHPYEIRRLTGYLGWGYTGTGAGHAAEAILRDALNLPDDVAVPQQLREAFCEDVVAHLAEEFLLRRGAVLRWARGWAVQHEVTDLPEAVGLLPPVSRFNYADRPEAVHTAQERAAASRSRRR